MKQVDAIDNFDKIKMLADPRRLQILRLLMATPATITQVAQQMGRSPAWVKHHVNGLVSAELITQSETRTTGKVTEKYYRANASALLLQQLILPQSDKPTIVFSGSHDLALEQISRHIAPHVTLLMLPVGSLDGLVNLRQGLCQISGAHLRDRSGEYNTPFIRHLFPDRHMSVVTLANRTQGLMLKRGNPLGLRDVTDLAQKGVRFINRNAGSGTRLWLDEELQRQNIMPSDIAGYAQTVNSHTACAQAIASGAADAAIGLYASAENHDLDFIPLFEERYDFVLPQAQQATLAPLLDHIQTAAFRHAASALTGYSTTHSGAQISLNQS